VWCEDYCCEKEKKRGNSRPGPCRNGKKKILRNALHLVVRPTSDRGIDWTNHMLEDYIDDGKRGMTGSGKNLPKHRHPATWPPEPEEKKY